MGVTTDDTQGTQNEQTVPPEGGEPQGAAQGGNESAGKVEFTPEQQAAIDRLVAERVKRAETAAEKRAKTAAEEAAKRAQMDESERLKAEKADAEKRAADALALASRTMVNAEARIAAAAAGAKPERLERIVRLLDLDAVAVEDGVPDSKAVAAAVKALKAELPELFGGAAASASRSGAEIEGGDGKRTWTRAQIAELSRKPDEYAKHEEEIDAAYREGRIVD